MNTLVTNEIKVSVRTIYLPEHSDEEAFQHYFGYLIRIENDGPDTVQLLRRHWLIYDSVGILREVEGEGVVGEQPIILPGQFHEYSSFCDLRSDIGKMLGSYLMVRLSDESFFRADIPEFYLVAPFRLN